MGLVFGVERVVDQDGPGLRTVFLFKGCKLRCWWCHSPEGQRKQKEVFFYADRCDACGDCLAECSSDALIVEGDTKRLDRKRCRACGLCLDDCKTGALQVSGEWLTVPRVMEIVERDRPDYERTGGGVTLSGGDVTLQPAFAREILQACRERGIHTVVETNGYAPWPILKSIVELSDLVLYDVKHADSATHARYTGVGNELILQNLAETVALGANVQVRMPLIPGHTDSDENLSATVDLVAGLGLRRIAFLPYVVGAREKYALLDRVYWLGHLQRQSSERLEEVRQIALARGLEPEIVG